MSDTFDVAREASWDYCEGSMTVPVGSRTFVVMGVVLAALASSCANSKTRTRGSEESVSSTASSRASASAASTGATGDAPSCGHEVSTHGAGYDETARTCLWDAYRAGKEADLALTRHTIEGDPITFTIHVRPGAEIEVFEDNRDHFGAAGVRSSKCKVLERSPIVDGRSGFIVRGCAGSVEKIEVP